MTISRQHFLQTIKVSFQERLHFPLRADNTVDKRHASLFNGTRRSCDKPLLGVSTPDKSISWENLTMCSNPHWSYSNSFQHQTHVSLVPLPEKINTRHAVKKPMLSVRRLTSALHLCSITQHPLHLNTAYNTPLLPQQQQGLALYHAKLELTCSSEITATVKLPQCLTLLST